MRWIIMLALSCELLCAQPKYSVTVVPTDSAYIPFIFDDQARRDSIRRNYGNWHDGALAVENYLLSKGNPGVRRNAVGNIEVTLQKGEVLELRPEPNTEEAAYAFVHHYKELGLLLFRVQWSEGNNYALIDQNTGHKTYLIGLPYFSPDRTFLLAVNADVDAHYSNNGFQLFRRVGREFQKVWSYDPNVWGPFQVKWIDNHTALTCNVHEDPANKDFRYTKVIITKD